MPCCTHCKVHHHLPDLLTKLGVDFRYPHVEELRSTDNTDIPNPSTSKPLSLAHTMSLSASSDSQTKTSPPTFPASPCPDTAKILCLPPDTLHLIISHALPAHTSTLDPQTFVPLAARATESYRCDCCDRVTTFPITPIPAATTLSLVHRAFWEAVEEVIYRQRVLRVVLWNQDLDYALNPPSASGTDGIGPPLYDIFCALSVHEDNRSLRLKRLSQIPLQRFREIQIALYPQLLPLGIPREVEGYFFPSLGQWAANDALWGGGRGRYGWGEMVDMGLMRLVNEARGIAQLLRSTTGVREAVGKREMKVRVVIEDGDEDWRKEMGKGRGNKLPVSWARYNSESIREVVDGERLPVWTAKSLWGVVDAYRWVYHEVGGCAVKSLLGTMRFPSFIYEHRYRRMASVEVHAYLRREMVRVWRGEESWATRSEETGGEENEGGRRVVLVKNLQRRLLPWTNSPLAAEAEDCGRCRWCLSEEDIWDQPPNAICGDAFKIERGESPAIYDFHESLEERILELILWEWPQLLAIEYEALLYSLINLQVEVLGRALPTHGNCGLDSKSNGSLGAQRRLLMKFVATIDRCLVSMDELPDESKQAAVEMILNDMPGGFDRDAVRRRLGWCEMVCQHPKHWANMRKEGRHILSALAMADVHPALIRVIVEGMVRADSAAEAMRAAAQVGVELLAG